MVPIIRVLYCLLFLRCITVYSESNHHTGVPIFLKAELLSIVFLKSLLQTSRFKQLL